METIGGHSRSFAQRARCVMCACIRHTYKAYMHGIHIRLIETIHECAYRSRATALRAMPCAIPYMNVHTGQMPPGRRLIYSLSLTHTQVTCHRGEGFPMPYRPFVNTKNKKNTKPNSKNTKPQAADSADDLSLIGCVYVCVMRTLDLKLNPRLHYTKP